MRKRGDVAKREEAEEDVDMPQRGKGGNEGSTEDRQHSNPPSNLSVSFNSPPHQMPWSIKMVKARKQKKMSSQTPQCGKGGNKGSTEDRQRSNPPSNLSVSSDSPPMMEICVGSTEENSQAPSSILVSMSFHRLNALALREIDEIARYVDNWQPPASTGTKPRLCGRFLGCREF